MIPPPTHTHTHTHTHLAAQCNSCFLDLLGWRIGGVVGQEGDETQELSQQPSHEEHRGEPLLLILRESWRERE